MADPHDGKQHESYQFTQVKGVVIAIAIILAIVALSFVGMVGYFHMLKQVEIKTNGTPSPMLASQKPYEGSLLQAVPPAELAQVRAETQKRLSEYGWIDQDAGSVHIPISQAMEMALQRGYPVRKDVMTP